MYNFAHHQINVSLITLKMKAKLPVFLLNTLLAAVCLFFVVSVESRDIRIDQDGANTLDLKENTYEQLRFSTTMNHISTFKVSTDMGMFTSLRVPGYSHTYVPGQPELPVLRRLIEFPLGARPEVEVISSDFVEYELTALGIDFPVIPAQPPQPKDGTPVPFEYDRAAYAKDVFTSAPLVDVEVLGTMRGLRIARVDIAPVQYNPVSGMLRLYTSIEARVIFRGADVIATIEQKKKNDAPYFRSAGASLFNYKAEQSANRDTITKYPVKFVIVSDPMFEAQLQPYVEWKTQKGFTVVEAYTDDPAVGSTTSSIKNYLQSLYDAGTTNDPAPSFVLFVGDVDQIPAWSGAAGWHATDLPYVEYTGDYFPEVYFGRWSATNPSELQPQIDKTLQYEQFTMPDPSYLEEVVMVAGMDGSFGQNWANGQINYGTENYFNAAHGLFSHTYLYPESGSHSADIIQNVSDGVSFGNYTAHCSANGWADPSFGIGNVAGLQNQDEYCVLIGNCCSSNEYNNYCFGEALLRAANKGAVGYIGGSNSTYWDEDYYFGVGVGPITADPPSYEETTLGTYDRAFHDHGEPWEDWYTTTYQMIFAGNLAVTQGSPGSAQYYWEIYCVMGDPSLECYFGVPDPMTVSYDPLMPLAATSFTVTAAPYAYVGISMGGVLHGAALADETGIAVVALDPILVPGDADIVVTKQNAQPFIGTVAVANPEGPYVVLSGSTINDPDGNNNGLADYNENITLDIELENLGAQDALGVEAVLNTSDEHVTITDDQGSWGTIPVGSSVLQEDVFAVYINEVVPDQHLALFELEITGSSKEVWYSSFNILLNAPLLHAGPVAVDDSQGGNGNGKLDPGETADIIVTLANNGHSDAFDAVCTLASTSNAIVINTGSATISELPFGTSAEAVFNVTVDEDTPAGTSISFGFEADAMGYLAELEFFMVSGQIPVAIVDLDPNNSSAPEMMGCLENLSVGGEYFDAIPADLNMYSSVFVCLGVYSDNHALTADEGDALAGYLNNGGNLYMEGGDTWAYDAQTAVHPMFGITGIEDGSGDLGTILGQPATFTEGMSYTYSGENNWIDRISPAGAAFSIFNNQLPPYTTAVANIGSTYRTIGSSHEFGGLEDDEYTKDYLMYKYLEFFGIEAVWVGLHEQDQDGLSFGVYPNPAQGNARIVMHTSGQERVSMMVYNAAGQIVAIPAMDKLVQAGEHSIEVDISTLPAGIYNFVLTTGEILVQKKVVVL